MRLYKLSFLTGLAVVLSSLLLLPATSHSQQNNPEKEKLFTALREGRLLKRDLKVVIKQMEQYGVSYELSDAEKIEVRRLGKYLGKKGLDDLIEAIRKYYRAGTLNSQPYSSTSTDLPLSILNGIPFKGGSPQRLDALMKAAGYTGTTSMSALSVRSNEANESEILISTHHDLNAKNSERLLTGDSMNFPGGENTARVYIRSDKDGMIDVEYRPKSALSTATPSQQPPEVKEGTPKPNLTIASYGKLGIIYDPATRTFKESLDDKGIQAIIVQVRNAHEPGKEITEAKDIRAHIGYEPFDYYKNLDKNIPGFNTADDGVWFREAQPVVNFARGETKTLILAIRFPDGDFGAFTHPIEQREGIRIPFPLVLKLIADKYVVKVQLAGGTHGEVYEFHVFTITLRPEFTITYG